MIKGISHWTIPPIEPDAVVTPHQAIDAAAQAGFPVLEPAIALTGPLSTTTTQSDCETIKEYARSKGVKLQTAASAITWTYCPTDHDPDVRKKSIQLHTDAITRAAWLGAKSFLFVPGAVCIPWKPQYTPVPYDAALDWALEAAKTLAAHAQNLGLELCIENVWNGLLYSPLETARFVDAIGHDAGMYLDVGNLPGIHQHPPHWVKLLAHRIRRIHVKDFKNRPGGLTSFCELLEGDMPWPETMAALKEIGYDGTVIAELANKPGVLERTSQSLDKILAM